MAGEDTEGSHVIRTRPGRPPAAVSAAVLAAALAVELIDELVDGTKGAALPLMRHDLGLSYTQLGLLASVPVLIGSFAELPMGLLAALAGLGNQEIAQSLCIPYGTVCSRLSRARKRVRSSFGGINPAADEDLAGDRKEHTHG